MAFKTKENSVYSEMLQAYKDNGATVANKFEGQVSAGGNLGFEPGDKIAWPDVLEVIKTKLNGGGTAQMILVEVTDKDGATRIAPFYPTSLGKSIRRVETDSEGKVTKKLDFVRPTGQPALDYQSKGNMSIDKIINDMMQQHPNGITVEDYEMVTTNRFNSNESTQTRRYKYAYTA